MALKWEFIGKQELWESGVPKKGYAYQILMWRTKVPGGWLVLTINSKSSSPQPAPAFCPDPTHAWNISEDTSESYLLRPAMGQIANSPETLLLASSNPNEAEAE